MKHGGSVSVTARQQTYYASNLEQGSGEVPSPSVLRKAKLWNDSIARNCWRNAGETLACCTNPQKSYHDLKEITTIPDASFV